MALHLPRWQPSSLLLGTFPSRQSNTWRAGCRTPSGTHKRFTSWNIFIIICGPGCRPSKAHRTDFYSSEFPRGNLAGGSNVITEYTPAADRLSTLFSFAKNDGLSAGRKSRENLRPCTIFSCLTGLFFNFCNPPALSYFFSALSVSSISGLDAHLSNAQTHYDSGHVECPVHSLQSHIAHHTIKSAEVQK